MTRKPICSLLTIVLSSVISLSPIIAAQQQPGPRYKLIDLGTFGGPNSSVGGQSVVISKTGDIVGGADTSIPDPYAPACFNEECVVEHAFLWKHGTLTDLGALPGGDSSFGYAMNKQELVVGWSQNGVIDPLTGAPEYVPAAWHNGKIIEIGTFGGAFGQASAVNDNGFVVGAAENTTPDPFALASGFGIAGATELHAFGWTRDRGLFDLGSLGGPGAVPLYVNNHAQVAGTSFTSSIPGPSGVPPLEPFLWEDGNMISLGTLRGTFGIAAKVTNQGQVVGDSDLAGDTTQHGFSWKDGVLTDIGTLGGAYSSAKWVNEAGEVVGLAKTKSGHSRAFRWKNGHISDLGTVAPDLCSIAWSINEAGQIVGNSSPECHFLAATERAFLWEKGQLYDLNSFVPADSQLDLFEADSINDRGDITGPALLPNGDVHQYLLLRCGSRDSEVCRESDTHRETPARNTASFTQRFTKTHSNFGADYLQHPSVIDTGPIR